jgi:hypothetical protein
MAIKTFTTGEVLTAADTNTYLANSGLVYVAGGSFATAGTVDITGFNSSFDYYRIIWRAQRVDDVGGSVLTAQLFNGATVRNTAYFASAFFASYLATTGVSYVSSNAANFTFSLADSGALNVCTYDIRGMTSGNAVMTGNFWDTGSARNYISGAFHNVTETNDKLRITSGTGTITGNWRLYGYREP